MTLGFKHAGDLIYLIGESRNDINCSEYLHHICGVTHSPAPHFDLEEEYAVQQTVAKLIEQQSGEVSARYFRRRSLCLPAGMCDGHGLGFNIHTDKSIRKDAFLFGEAQSRVVITVNPEIAALVEAEMRNIPFTKIGQVNAKAEVTVDDESWGFVSDWKNAYDTSLEKMLVG